MYLGIIILRKLVQLLNARSPIIFIDLGNRILSNDEQFENAYEFIQFNVSGKFISYRFVQFAKHESGILSNILGSLIFSKLLQLAKVKGLNVLIVFGIFISDNDLQS